MLDTKGAASYLGCSITWIRKLAAKGDTKKGIRAYIYLDGALAVHEPSNPHPGVELFFREEDLLAYSPGIRRKPMGAKDKIKDNPNRKTKTRAKADIAEAKNLIEQAMEVPESHRKQWYLWRIAEALGIKDDLCYPEEVDGTKELINE